MADCRMGNLSEIPLGPVHPATEEELKNIMGLYNKLKDQKMFKEYGSVKITTPSSYQPTLPIPDKTKLTFDDPYRMMVSQLEPKFYFFERAESAVGDNITAGVTLADIEKFGNRPSGLTDFNDIEEAYWNEMEATPKESSKLLAVYGADVEMSLSKAKCEFQTLRNMPSLLSHILRRYGGNVPGVNLPMMYFGGWKATFPWHTEDKDACAINYLHYGDAKFWYTISADYARDLEALSDTVLSDFLKNEMHDCTNFLRHKSLLIDPRVLVAKGIPVCKHIQEKGEFVIVDMMSYHAGFNSGINCAESVNFANGDWIRYGIASKLCHDSSITGGFDMEMFIYEYYYKKYYKYLEGEWDVFHPLTNEMVIVKPPGIPKINEEWSSYESFEYGVVAVLATKTYKGIEYVLVEMQYFKTWLKRTDLSFLKWHGISTPIHVPDEFFSTSRTSPPPIIYNGTYLERGVCPVKKTPTLLPAVERKQLEETRILQDQNMKMQHRINELEEQLERMKFMTSGEESNTGFDNVKLGCQVKDTSDGNREEGAATSFFEDQCVASLDRSIKGTEDCSFTDHTKVSQEYEITQNLEYGEGKFKLKLHAKPALNRIAKRTLVKRKTGVSRLRSRNKFWPLTVQSICPNCGKDLTSSYASRSNQLRHVRECIDGTRFECVVCFSRFLRKDALKNHFEKFHNDKMTKNTQGK